MTPNRTADSTTVLRTMELAAGYRDRRERQIVLERLNVSVDRGELVCLLGPNGSGKSTLLRTLARMQRPLSGRIEIDGTPLESLSALNLARRVGLVLTERVAVESLRVKQVVEFGRYPHSGWLGRLSSRDAEVVSSALDAVGATHLADRDFARISDGERQRVMLARALAQEPLLLMLDEPTAFLDVPSRVELMVLLRRLTRLHGLGIVVSTHDLDLALRAADLLWLLKPGGTVAIGAPEDLVLSGAIARTFEGRNTRFDPEQRTFGWMTESRGAAVVSGRGPRADMARAVLEREGYAIVSTKDGPLVTAWIDDAGWTVDANGKRVSGQSFRALALHLREDCRVQAHVHAALPR